MDLRISLLFFARFMRRFVKQLPFDRHPERRIAESKRKLQKKLQAQGLSRSHAMKIVSEQYSKD